MDLTLEVVKASFLFLAVWFSLRVLIRAWYRFDISVRVVLLQAIGITGFVYLQWLL